MKTTSFRVDTNDAITPIPILEGRIHLYKYNGVSQ